MKIQIIRPTVQLNLAYSDPDVITVNKALGKELIELGYAIELEEGETELPADFPGRKILEENGFLTFAEIKRIATVEQLMEIKGIGKKLAENIIAALPQ
jgi:hypothetical protein